jgi:pyruvate dehydrogenase E2 component (dihydrolipoamide acetyltransferase)
MPKLSDSMQEGKIIQWKVKEGDAVHEGDVLAEVESDKAVMEMESFRNGVVAEIRHGDGAEVPVGTVIALIRVAGKQGAGKVPLADETKEPAEAGAPQEKGATAAVPLTPRKRPAGARIAISPYARKLAEERGVDPSKVEGSGPGGRIVAQDILQAAAGTPAASVAQTGPPAEEPATAPGRRLSPEEDLPAIEVAEGEAEVEAASYRLRTQARRVMASQHTIPHFYVTRSVDVTALLDRKDDLKAQYGATLTHLVMFACVQALTKRPEVNRSYDRGRVIKWKGTHLGLAVDTDYGLTVAVLRDAQEMGLRELVEKTAVLVEHARADKLSGDERRHPTLTVTNLGMFDVEHFEPIINPPSAVTLAVGSALPAAIVRNGALYVGKLMKLTAACDHRIIDGATAARFLVELRQLLEHPEALLQRS